MKKILALLLLCTAALAHAQVVPLREQARMIDTILAERLDQLLPDQMKSTGIDMWILVSREYNESPVLKTMLPADWLNARRTTILVFYRAPATGKVEKLAIARYNVGTTIKAAWDTAKYPNQWDALTALIKERKPRTIGIDTSEHFAHADGLDHTNYLQLMRAMPPGYAKRVVAADTLAVMWLESRSARELSLYPQLVAATHKIIAEGFSARTIVPGTTTTEDLEWWFRQRIRDSGYDTWFHPSVAIQRKDAQANGKSNDFSSREASNVIIPGDLLHVDIGITYLRLNTDVQQHAYMLLPGETQIPASLKAALGQGNRLQDVLTGQFRQGRTGNQILAAALAQAKSEGIVPTIYTHPIGYHGHAAGPTIGLWDMQGGVPGSGDFPMHYRTAYSIELNAETYIPEWNKKVRIMLEEDGYFDESGFRYLDGRQTQMIAVGRDNAN